MKKIFFIFICAVSLLYFCQDKTEIQHFPALTGQVVDEAKILSEETEKNILSLLKPNQQFVVVTLKSLNGKEIEEYGIELARHWQIGDKNKNDGILLIVAPNEHQTRIEVGYGMEGTVTDAIASQIVNNVLLPNFRANNYDRGVLIAVKKLLDVINGKPLVIQNENHHSSNTAKARKDSHWDLLPLIPFGLFWFYIPIIILFKTKKQLSEKKQKQISEKIKAMQKIKTLLQFKAWQLTEAEASAALKNIKIDKTKDFSVKDEKALSIIKFLVSLTYFAIGLCVLGFTLNNLVIIFLSFTARFVIGFVVGFVAPSNGYAGKSRSGSSYHHSSSHSSGSSFSGGGGSFGGGGASGRW